MGTWENWGDGVGEAIEKAMEREKDEEVLHEMKRGLELLAQKRVDNISLFHIVIWEGNEMAVKMNIEKQVQQFLAYITEKRTDVDGIAEDLLQMAQRKKQLFQRRSAHIVKATADVSFIRQLNSNDHQEIDYQIHFKYLIKHKELFYIEEEQLKRRVCLNNSRIIGDYDIEVSEEIRMGETLERKLRKRSTVLISIIV